MAKKKKNSKRVPYAKRVAQIMSRAPASFTADEAAKKFKIASSSMYKILLAMVEEGHLTITKGAGRTPSTFTKVVKEKAAKKQTVKKIEPSNGITKNYDPEPVAAKTVRMPVSANVADRWKRFCKEKGLSDESLIPEFDHVLEDLMLRLENPEIHRLRKAHLKAIHDLGMAVQRDLVS